MIYQDNDFIKLFSSNAKYFAFSMVNGNRELQLFDETVLETEPERFLLKRGGRFVGSVVKWVSTQGNEQEANAH